jgi:branched-chain amino acid transport system ATP-binding protein
MPPRLEVRGLTKAFLGVQALDDVSFSVAPGEVLALIGENGAGKSTLIRILSGAHAPDAGEVLVDGRAATIDGPAASEALGIRTVYQELNLFPDLTVAENLAIGGMVGKRPRAERLAEVMDLFPQLSARSDQSAGTLSGGEAQMVAVGRALMQDPQLLLLDEPTAGLSPKYVDGLFSTIKKIQTERGIGVLLAEQNAGKTLAIADRALILNLGKVFLVEEASRVDDHTLKQGYRL